MKGISKNYSYYFKLLTMILLFTFLYACAGVTPTDYTITTTTSVGGSINPAGAITVTDGGNQTFTITPDKCYEIADILVDGTSIGPIETYTFSDVDQNHTIQVSFVLDSKVYNIDTGIHYDTIQKAIYAARSGDTIIVCPGIYEENIVFNNEDLIVRSIDPSDPSIVAATIIDGGGSGSVVRFDGDDTSTLEGFTIKNGNTTYGGGIHVSGSSPTIIGNIISNNEANDGAGIYVYSGSPIITGNNINDNKATGSPGSGGGIYSFESPSIIDNNIIENNEATAGGGIYAGTSFPIIINNIIQYNKATTGGGFLIWNSSPTIEDNTITNNEAVFHGGGIFISYSSSLSITDNTITDNMAGDTGGGISVYFSFITITENTITDNTISNNEANDGGGIYVDTSSLTVTGNTITSNTAYGEGGYGGGGIYVNIAGSLLPETDWGIVRNNIPTNDPLNPAEGIQFEIAGNVFLDNEHGQPPAYTEGAHVYFE